MNVYEKLLAVQSSLKVPKNQINEYSPSKYKYRNLEDIQEAVKPLLVQNKALIIIEDDLVLIGNRYYIKATAIFVDVESTEKITNTAFAREEETKKGMDASQITGSASSYARKYALNGLLAIDDTKDADSQDNSQNNTKPANNYVCAHCGKPFTDFVWNGRSYTAGEAYEIAKKKCNGIALCNQCKKKAGIS